MQRTICELYISYIKNLISFIIICQLFSIGLRDLEHYTRTLQHQELFLIFSRIDGLIESILKVFEQKQYCQGIRVLQSVIYLVFVDLLQIYQSYYLLITVMLEKFGEMKLSDAKRAFIIYLNFVKINKEIRKMASSVCQEFNIKIGITFYDIDTKVIEGLKLSIDLKEREQAGVPMAKKTSIESYRSATEDAFELPTFEPPAITQRKKSMHMVREKEELKDSSGSSATTNKVEDFQGGQGEQRRVLKRDSPQLKTSQTIKVASHFKPQSNSEKATTEGQLVLKLQEMSLLSSSNHQPDESSEDSVRV